jgi:hypothetical protein
MFGDQRSFLLVFRCTIALLVSATSVAGQSTLRSVRVSTVGGEAVVTVEATGPLPSPTLGALDGPPRVFLDFANVRLAAQGLTRTSDPRIRRVRVGIFSVNPLVTRVVIDLTAVLPHRIEVATGRVMVFLGDSTSLPASAAPAPVREPARGVRPVGVATPEAATPAKPTPSVPATRTTSSPAAPRPESPPSSTAIPPVPPLPPPPAETSSLHTTPRVPSSTDAAGSRLPYRPPSPPPSSKDIEKYRAQAGTLLERLKLQMPLLDLMQSLDEELGSRMPTAIQEFDRLREELEAIKPPETVRAQHELLLQATRLGSTAARLRMEAIQTGNAAIRRNAASAAAGASLMLDRAFAEVGLVPEGR